MPNPHADEALAAEIKRIASASSLQSWNELVRSAQVPPDLLPAVMSDRAELVALVPRRPYSAEEVSVLLDLVQNLIETNGALRDHAAQLSILVDQWEQNFRALRTTGERIKRFARFDHAGAQDDD